MWCPSCRADVATELSSDFRRFSCPHCGVELGVAAAALQQKAGRTADPATGAAAVLARWAAEEKLPYEAAVSGGAHPPRSPVTVLPAREGASPNSRDSAVVAVDHSAAHSPLPQDVSEVVQRSVAGSQAWLAGAGHVLAYGGVLVLTCGTVMIISRQFGPAAGNALSGWLVAALGQMLLLLGVVTLVANSLEQARLEVLQRLELMERRWAGNAESSDSPSGTPTAAQPDRRRAA